MKLAAAAFTAALLAAGTAAAQTAPSTQFYGSVGYTHYGAELDGQDLNLGTVDGRIGARFGRFIGVEGEAGVGVKSDEYIPPNIVCAAVVGADCSVDVKIKNKLAGYLVGFLPISEQADLFARAGYGRVSLEVDGFGVEADESENAFSYGAGGQFFLDGVNGVRGEYTRAEFDEGGDVDSLSVSYVRKF